MKWTKIESKKNLAEYGEREFPAEITLQQLKVNFWARWASWGVSSIQLIAPKKENGYNYCKGVLLKVSGHHHKGYVLITLGFEDLYNIYLVNYRTKEAFEEIKGIFCDELVDTIDDRIERIDEYEK